MNKLINYCLYSTMKYRVLPFCYYFSLHLCHSFFSLFFSRLCHSLPFFIIILLFLLFSSSSFLSGSSFFVTFHPCVIFLLLFYFLRHIFLYFIILHFSSPCSIFFLSPNLFFLNFLY